MVDQVFTNNMTALMRHSYLNNMRHIAVAVSGGCDSLALLLLLNRYCHINQIKITCLTLDHGLRSESKDECEYVAQICADMQINCIKLLWKPVNKSVTQKISRDARYQILVNYCNSHNIKHLFIGHHWNDQLETILMRKMKNSTMYGLAGMSAISQSDYQANTLVNDNVYLIRPLLNVTKTQLQQYLRQQQVPWYVDPSNNDDKYLRTAMREQLADANATQLEELTVLHQQAANVRIQMDDIYNKWIDTHLQVTNTSSYNYDCDDNIITDDCVQAHVSDPVAANYAVSFACSALANFVDNDLPPQYHHRLQLLIIYNILSRVSGSTGHVKLSKLSNIVHDIINAITNKPMTQRTLFKCLIKIKKGKVYIGREDKHNTQQYRKNFVTTQYVMLDKIANI